MRHSIVVASCLLTLSTPALAATPELLLCTPGKKTIFFDVGSGGVRDGTGPGGGKISAGDRTIGCFEKDTGEFTEQQIVGGDDVRLVLLDTRPDYDYGLLLAGHSGLEPAKEVKLTAFDNAGPVCGPGGFDCDRDAAELDQLLAELDRSAAAVVRAAKNTAPDAQAYAGETVRCAKALADTTKCTKLTRVSQPKAGTGWWLEFAGASGAFDGQLQRVRFRKSVLCEKWKERASSFVEEFGTKANETFDATAVARVLAVVHEWASETHEKLAGRRQAVELLQFMNEQSKALGKRLGDLKDLRHSMSGVAVWHEINSYRYNRNNHKQFCPDAAADGQLDVAISNALYVYRQAQRDLESAFSARVFGLQPMEPNSEVIVTVIGAPVAETKKAAAPEPEAAVTLASATTGDAQKGSSGDSTRATAAYQFTYRVGGVSRLGFSVGTAVVAAKESHGHRLISPEPAPVLFFNWRLWEMHDGRFPAQRWGVQAGVALDDAGNIVAGKDVKDVNLYFGGVLWPVKTVAVSAGVVDFVAASRGVQLGFYLGLSADIPALLEAWKGPQRILAR